MTLKEEVEKIKLRNTRVEEDKAWEVSRTRRISITILTYIVIVIFFYRANLPRPFINALVPTLGFILSTLSLDIIRKVWSK